MMSSLMMYASSSSSVSCPLMPTTVATGTPPSSVPVMDSALGNPRRKWTARSNQTKASKRRRQPSQTDMIQKTRKPKKIILGRPCHGKHKMTVDELKALSRRICPSDNNRYNSMHASTAAAHTTQQPYTAETIVSLSRHLKTNLFRAKTKMMDSLKRSDVPRDIQIYRHLASHHGDNQHHIDNNSKAEMVCATPTTTQTIATTPSPGFGATTAANATTYTNATTPLTALGHIGHPHALDELDMETEEEEEEEDDYSSVSTTLSSVHQFPHQHLRLVTDENGHVSIQAHPSGTTTTAASARASNKASNGTAAAASKPASPVVLPTNPQETDHFDVTDIDAIHSDNLINNYIASAMIPFYTPMAETGSLCHSSTYNGLMEQYYHAFYWPSLFNPHFTGTASDTELKDEVTEDQINSWLQRGGYSDIASMTMATDQELAALVDFDHL